MSIPAERKRAERARKGVQPRAAYLAAVAAKCGTVRGYRNHLKNNEPTCPACRAAWAASRRA